MSERMYLAVLTPEGERLVLSRSQMPLVCKLGKEAPTEETCPEGCLYIQTNTEEESIGQYLGTSTGPLKVTEFSTSVGGVLSGKLPNPGFAKQGELMAPRTLMLGCATLTPATAANTRFLFKAGAITNESEGEMLLLYTLVPSLIAVSGVKTYLRVTGSLLCNGTAPTGEYKIGLVPISTVGGASEKLKFTAGAILGESAVTAPAAGAAAKLEGAKFSVPSEGAYALVCVNSAKPATGAAVGIVAQLEVIYE